MAVWIYAYGKNGIATERHAQTNQYLDVLNNIPVDEVKILDSILELKHLNTSVRKYYTDNRRSLEDYFKSMAKDEYSAYLQSIKLPFIEIDNIIDHFIVDGEKHEYEKEANFKFAYDQFKSRQAESKWELSDNGLFINKLVYFDAYDGLRLRIMNDLVWISGPSPVFSVYDRFLTTISTASRDYYHTYFKSILSAFRSDFILYTHEWSGLKDEEDEEFNLAKLKEQSNWEVTSSNSIHTMDNFYYEHILPV